MTARKKRRLANKRTPWDKSRFSRRARALRVCQISMIAAVGSININQIRRSPAFDELAKAKRKMAIAECTINISEQISRVKLQGSIDFDSSKTS